MTSTMSLEEAWRLAIEKERESRALYLRLAAQAGDSAQKNLFRFLASEEEKHERMLQDEFDRAFTPDM